MGGQVKDVEKQLTGGAGSTGSTPQPTTVGDVDEPSAAVVGMVRRWRRVPTIVWAITGLHVTLMVLCSVLYPPFTGYDEAWHVDMTWSYYQGNGVYGPGQRLMDRGIEVAVESVQTPPPKVPYADAPILPRDQRLSFGELSDDRPVTYPVPNQMVQHPPLYYAVEAGLLHAIPGSENLPYDQQVWLLRLFSILLMAPVPLLCWATARRLVGDGPAPVLAALVPVTIPGLSRLGGSVNNDNLLILLFTALIYVLARVVTGDLRKRTGLLVGVLGTLALLTKGFALVLPVVIAAAYGAAWLRHRRRPLAPVGIAALVIGAFGSAWWVRNLVLYGAVQPSGLGPYWTAQIAGPSRPGGTATAFVPGFFRRLVARVWGGFGLPDVPHLHERVVDSWFILLVVGALIGVGYGIGRDGRRGRLAAAVFLLPIVGILGIVFTGSLDAFLFNQRYAGVQGRYLYPGLAGLAVLAAWGWCRLAGRGARFLPLVVALAGLATQARAWMLLMISWWAPRTDGYGVAALREALGGVLRWSPWPHKVTLVPFVLFVLLSLAILALSVRGALRQSTLSASPVTRDPGRPVLLDGAAADGS